MFYYYLLTDKDKDKFCKLGVTKNYQQRLRPYKTLSPNAYFYKVWEISSNIQKEQLERSILRELSCVFIIQNETVIAPPSIVANVIEGFFLDENIEVKEVVIKKSKRNYFKNR
jgi:hypothetical protein